MLRRFVSLLVALVMIISVIPVSISAEGVHMPGTHSEAHTCEKCNKTVNWTAWGDDPAEKTSLPTSGHYYLVDNVDMSNGTRTVASDLCLCLNGFTITAPQKERTLAVAAANKFIAISDCTATYVDGMYTAGKITGGKNTTIYGGTIYVGNNNCKLYFYDGIIENCESTAGGGAIFVATGSSTKIPEVYMYGGALRNNETPAAGGAVRVGDYGQFYMTGGEIVENRAKLGGGIYAGSNVTVAVKNASVTQNHATEQAGGLQVTSGTISLQEEAIITGNTAVNKDTANNLYLLKGHAGAAASKLAGNAKIGVTLAADRIAEGQMHVTTAVAGTDAKYFESDYDTYEPKLENNRVVLVEKVDTPPTPPVPTHSHNGCNDALCTEHVVIGYEKWSDSTKLPTSGKWYLDTDVTVTNQTVLSGDLDLCLNGKTITGCNGKRILASVSGYTLTIADCTAKTKDGIYTAGKLTGAVSTASNGQGGAINLGAKDTLYLFDGMITGNCSYVRGGGVNVAGTMYMYGGEISGNTAKNGSGAAMPGGGVYVGSNAKLYAYGGIIKANEASIGAGIYAGGGATIVLEDVQVTDNTASASAAGMLVTSGTVTVKGETEITGNTVNDKNENVVLQKNMAGMDANGLTGAAKIGITLTADRISGGNMNITTGAAADLSVYFKSDDASYNVVFDGEVKLETPITHIHCVQGHGDCSEHDSIGFTAWNDANKLPEASGKYYLTTDVTVTNRAGLSNANITLCLDGHTIRVADGYEKGRGFYLRGSSKLTLTDCAKELGVITGAKESAVMFDSSCVGAELNIYNITLTGNTTTAAGGAVCVQGESVFNLYSGQLIGNTATTVLLLDASGQPQLDAEGNQQLKQKLGGGAVAVIGGKATFNMHGGTISNNCASAGSYTKADGKTATGGGHGGGIYSSGNVNLLGGKIADNTADGNGGGIILSGNNITFTMTGGEISGNKATNAGGILAQNKSLVLLSGGMVKNNAAATGGGVYISTNAAITMNGGTITANTASAKGGGMFLLGATAQLNAGTISANKAETHGGGIAATVGSVTVNGEKQNRPAQITVNSDFTITKNAADKNAGGIHVAGKDSTLTLNGGTISGNNAVGAAGGVLTEVGAVFVMKSGKISGNRAKTGAGAYISADTSIKMEGGAVTGNHATGNTGGIQMLRSQGVFSGGTISGNTTDTNGGGLYLSGATATLCGTSVTNNTATKNGGGVALSQVSSGSAKIPSKLVVSGSTISGNKGIGGGGVLVQTNTTLEIRSGAICNNQGRSGGGIYAGTDSTINMTGGSLSNNSAENHGGAVYHQLSVGNYTGGTITGNTAGVNGGGFLITGKTAIVTMKDLELHDFEAGSNAAVVLCQARATLNMENCKIYDNVVTKGSGAVYISTNSFSNLKNCLFFNNTAAKDGGAFYGAANCHVAMTDCDFTENESQLSGGAILCRGNVTMTDCSVSNNKAAVNGGGISTAKCGLRGSKFQEGLVMTNVTVTANEAAGQGGGLYLSTGCRTTMTDVTITGNVAGAEGGAFWAVDDTTLHNVTATGNTSGGKGYAVWYDDSLYDGHSYFVGVHKISGDIVVTDNNGGDVYLGKETALIIAQAGLGDKAKFNLTLDTGLLTNRLYGAYNYEGGNCVYTITPGDRSITDPEPLPADEQNEAANKIDTADAVLYVCIGVLAIAVAVVAILIAKKKKTPAGENK